MNNSEIYLSSSFQACKKLTNNFSTSFSMGIYFLGKKIRNPIYSIYGFVRVADEIVDTFFDIDQTNELNEFHQLTKDAITNSYSSNLILHAFQHVVNKYNIDRNLIDAFFDSMKSDLTEKKYDRESYKKYIYGSAEVVGLMCLYVFLSGNNNKYNELKYFARKLGSAFQKVNFLRDFQEDYQFKGRAYFPELKIDGELNESSKVQIETDIQKDFDNAKEGISKLPRSSCLGVYLAYRYYTKLLKKLKATPVDKLMTTRIRVNDFQKILLFPSALLFTIFMRKK